MQRACGPPGLAGLVWLVWLVALAALAALAADTKRYDLTVGYLTTLRGTGERQGLAISGALSMALDEINNRSDLLPSVRLVMRWEDTRGDTVVATRAITDMVCQGVLAFFGPEGPCLTEAIVAQARNLPMISYRCSDYQTSAIPTFARTEPPDTQVTKSVISLLRYYRWHKFSIVYEQPWETVALSLENHAKTWNMTVNHQRPVHDNMKCCEDKFACCAPGFWYQFIQDTKNRTRIYVFLGSASVLLEMMTAMESLQLFAKGEYMVIFVDKDTYTPTKEALKYLMKTEERSALSTCPMPREFRRRAQALLVIVSSPPADSYADFTNKVLKYNTESPFNFSLPPIFDKKFTKFVSIYAAYLYDAVKLYARALDELIREEPNPTESKIREIAANGTKIIATMVKSPPYKSITGATIKLDERADSEGNFSVLAFKPFNFSEEGVNVSCRYNMVPVGYFQQVNKTYPEYKLNSRLPIDWPDNVKPEDEPSCGFMDEKCPKDDSQVTSLVVAGTLAVTLFCALVITISIYRKWKIEQEIEGLLWKIDPQDILGHIGNDLCSPSKLSLASVASYQSGCGPPQVFASTGQYRGNVVRIKELKFSKKKDISREVMKEMRLLRELRHDNINSFIGASVEPMRLLLITDYCSKGSLYDIIENEDIKLDQMFISSLVHDLIKGMIFIHSSLLIFHGNLKSSNCVVTSRWMLQVTDFGLHEVRYCAESESIGEHQYYRSLLWKAPELLRALEVSGGVYGSQKGDVYAFGIILYEIIARRGPFGPTTLEPKEIVERVKRVPPEGEAVFRPDLSALEPAREEYVSSCMRDCWSEDPNSRPDFLSIRTRLKKMKSGKHRNIMDQMMEMMEKYANNLEELVNERTRLLFEEKQKTEDLLHRMLPKSVARKLTTGQGVEPESFDSVTIYFSDIVGFTAMSAESTPLQVVNFLNDLYTIFDRIIKGYDVYKVETIGDAYMVVSGLPIRNNTRHVGEIASMALELLNAVKSHKISHRQNETLKLRVGIHTGAVVAGVVGLTMPRYCLFGDTVNTASRMESTGEALRIHISPRCKAALDTLGGYTTEPRGMVTVKGKGELQTYWLLGATEKAIQKRMVEGEDMPPLFCRPRRSPRLNDSRQPSLCGGLPSQRHSSIPRSAYGDSCNKNFPGGSFTSLSRSPLARAPPGGLPAKPVKQSGSPYGSCVKPRHVLSSIASSTACEEALAEPGRPLGALRCTQSLDFLAHAQPRRRDAAPGLGPGPGPAAGRALAQLHRGDTSRSLGAYSAQDLHVSTVSGRHNSGSIFNGNVIGLCFEGDAPNKAEEDSPLLRKCSLYNKLQQPRKRVQDGNNVEFYKKWRSLENIDDVKTEMHSKGPLLGIKSWLLGKLNGGNLRSSNASLRKPAPLLDKESAV